MNDVPACNYWWREAKLRVRVWMSESQTMVIIHCYSVGNVLLHFPARHDVTLPPCISEYDCKLYELWQECSLILDI